MFNETAHPDLRAINALGMHRDLGGCQECRTVECASCGERHPLDTSGGYWCPAVAAGDADPAEEALLDEIEQQERIARNDCYLPAEREAARLYADALRADLP